MSQSCLIVGHLTAQSPLSPLQSSSPAHAAPRALQPSGSPRAGGRRLRGMRGYRRGRGRSHIHRGDGHGSRGGRAPAS